MYSYFVFIYNQLSLYCSSWFAYLNMNSNMNSSMNTNTRTNAKQIQNINKIKKCKPRSLICRNAFSPYTENEIKAIKGINYIITDEKRKSRLGKSVSFIHSPDVGLVEEGNFCSFIREWVLVE